MVTISGGKWTTYRTMAADAIDAAVKTGELHPVRPSCTEKLLLIGGPAYTPVTFTEVWLECLSIKSMHDCKVGQVRMLSR